MESEMTMEQLSKQTEKEKKRVRLTVAYDGTNYHGWQIQNNGITMKRIEPVSDRSAARAC